MAESNDMDDLEALLNQLDSPTEAVGDTEPKPEPKLEPSEDPLDDLEDLNRSDVGAVLRPVDERNYDNIIQGGATVSAPEPVGLALDVEEYRKQLKTVTTEVLDACHSDRQEAQDVINTLTGLLASTGPTKPIVDGLVKIIEVKANIVQNAIKVMDTNSKFLASIKSNIKVQQNVSISPEELTSLLEQPVEEID